MSNNNNNNNNNINNNYNDNNNNNWFYIATYHSHGESQTALQSIITPVDQLIPYIEMLSVQTFTSKCFQRSLSQVPITTG